MSADSPEEPRDAAELARSIIDADAPMTPQEDEVEYPNPMGGIWNALIPFRPHSGGIGPGLLFLGLIALGIVWAVIDGL